MNSTPPYSISTVSVPFPRSIVNSIAGPSDPKESPAPSSRFTIVSVSLPASDPVTSTNSRSSMSLEPVSPPHSRSVSPFSTMNTSSEFGPVKLLFSSIRSHTWSSVSMFSVRVSSDTIVP